LNNLGNPVISYFAENIGDVKVAVCGNATCTNKTLSTVDSDGWVGRFSALALTSTNIPVISYYDDTHNDLKAAICGNATCSSGNTVALIDSGGDVGLYTSVAINNLGNPVVSYYDVTNSDLKVAVCGNPTCSSGVTPITLDSAGIVGQYSSVVINSLGNPVISYYDLSNGDLKLVACGNVTCTGGNTFSIVDSAGAVGPYTSIVLNSLGNPVISYSDSSNFYLKLAVCGNATCSNGNNITTVDADGAVGDYTSIALSSAGNPVISYADDVNGDLKVAVCTNPTCTTKTITTVDSEGFVGEFTSVKLRADHRLFVSYYDRTNLDLKMYTDDTIVPPPPPTATPTITNTSLPARPDTIGVYKNGSWYLRNTNTSGSQDLFAVFGGQASDLPVTGAWNSDTVDSLGVYRSNIGQFILSNGNSGILAEDYRATFGNPGDTPFTGRWTVDMTHDGLGVYRNSNGILY